MQKQFAMTQVCQLTLTRAEIQRVLLDNMLKLGGEPSYDFATDHPIFIWNDDGSLHVRFVQAAVVAKEESRFQTLRKVPTEAEIEKKLRAAQPA